MITADTLLFLLGGFTFLFVFSAFKESAIEVFKKELASDDSHQSVWSKLLRVFLVDWLVCVIGVLGTGVVFVVIFNLAH
ncbi:MAG: hypothetical protein P8N65_00975 [SAR86 cluster bacterium]|jgi:flagellar biosynthesis protein FlhB|nr:hypothetical protein [Pseudomonadota bacterium]MDG1202413.1 hypothetical protein [SAR86 cluster bacterium]